MSKMTPMRWIMAVTVLSLIGCANVESPATKLITKKPIEQFTAQQEDDIAGGVLPKAALSPELLEQILAADLAALRHETDQSVLTWLKIANETKDARAAKHAALLALRAKDAERGEEAAALWVKLAPQSISARRLMIAMLLQNQQFARIIPHVELFLQKEPTEAPSFFAQLPLFWGQRFNLHAMVSTTEILTKPYLALPEAKYALAYAKQINGQSKEAIKLLDRALRQKPTLKVAKVLRQAIIDNPLIGKSPTSPMNTQEGLIHARPLVKAGNITEALRLYEDLLQREPNDIEVNYDYALLLWRQGELSEAVKKFNWMVKQNRQYVNEARIHLGGIAEQQADFQKAKNCYQQVEEPFKEDAQALMVMALAKAGQKKEALSNLRKIVQVSAAQKIRYIQLHAQLYFVQRQYDKAIGILTKGLKQFPQSADLYYDRAMSWEKKREIARSETDLRQALTLAPDNPVILNGLGFTLAEHHKDLVDAEKYLKQARMLSPNSPYIEDSFAWLLYRQGHHQEAEKILRKVFAIYKDPEVIAHLVELLWMKKNQDEAKDILRVGEQLFPHNEILLKTKQRLGIQ